MNTNILKKVETKQIKNDIPPFEPGDTIAVHTIIREGDKKRVQVFKGIVLTIKGSGTRKTFTVRKISFGVGVEKIFPLHSPNIEKIELLKKGKVRRAKLYYMRDRIGKKALKIKAGTLSKKDQKRIEELENLGVIEGNDEQAEAEVQKTEKKADAEKKD